MQLRISLDKNEQIFYIINGDSIPKNRKCEYTNKAQTIAVWAFYNFVRNLRTTICKKSINTLRQIMDIIFHKTDCATLTIFWGMYSLAKVTTWQLILSILVYTLFSRMFDLMQPPVVKHSIAVA